MAKDSRAAEYFLRVAAMMKATPRLTWPVAHARGDASERAIYAAWDAYFSWLGWRPETFGVYVPKGFTVPCENPADFDSVYEPPPARPAPMF